MHKLLALTAALLPVLVAIPPAEAVGGQYVSGVVVDASGASISGATVALYNSSTVASATTDATGRYSVQVPPGSYSFRLDQTDAYAAAGDVRVSGALTIGNEDLVENVTLPATATVHIAVTDATGNPVTDGTLQGGDSDHGSLVVATKPTTTSDGTPMTAQAFFAATQHLDNTGSATITALLGAPATVTIRPAHAASTVTIVDVPTDPTNATVTLDANPAVSGVVVDASGASISGATVALYNSSTVASATTDATGRYSVQVPPGSYSFRLDQTDAYAAAGDVRVSGALTIGNEDLVENVTLPATATVHIAVTDATGNPVTDGTLQGGDSDHGSLVVATKPTTTSDGTPMTAQAFFAATQHLDNTGSATITALLGAPATVTIRPAHAASTVTIVDVPTDPTNATVTLDANPAVSGVVVDASGASISGATVALYNSSTVASATTDATGRYSVQVPPGSYSFRLDQTDAYAAAGDVRVSGALTIGNEDLVENVTLPATATVHIAVTDATGNPVTDGTLQGGDSDHGSLVVATKPTTTSDGTPMTAQAFFAATQHLDNTGSATITALLGAPATVTIRPAHAASTVTIVDVPTDPTNATVTLDSLGRVPSSGTESGSVMLSVSSEFRLTNLTSTPVTSNSDGSTALVGALGYSVSGLKPGGSADVTLLLPGASSPTKIYKSDGVTTSDFTSHTTIAGALIVLHLVDGGAGDADGSADGTIVDPVIPTAARAQVTKVSPAAGSISGGTKVVITGTGFTAATAVNFGANAATKYTVNSATSITAYAPRGSHTGAVDITVTTPDGSTTATTTADRYTYTPPTVTKVSPAAGSISGGTKVVITGTGFTAATAVNFGANAATKYTVNSATSITAYTPRGSHTGAVDITVTTPDGSTTATTTADRYTYTPPTVTKVSPAAGSISGGTKVVITGTGFTAATAVNFGANAATKYTVNSATSITAYTPRGSHTGAVDITVTTPDGSTTATTTADRYTYTPPTVTKVSPAAGSISGGTKVVITGTGFTAATAVNFGANAATKYTVNSATSITAYTPRGSHTGAVDITVTTPDGSTTATTTADRYTYTPPTVTKVSPAAGSISGGTKVVITGTGFTAATAVNFGANAATKYTVNSATSITAYTPRGSHTGAVDITVTTPDGSTTATTTADHFTYK